MSLLKPLSNKGLFFNIIRILTKIIKQYSFVIPAKQKYVKNLMNYFSVPDDVHTFYEKIFKTLIFK